jgi:beta-lactamase regulating signal transducer with metallopeptidase domain
MTILEFLASKTYIFGLTVLALIFLSGILLTSRVIIMYLRGQKKINALLRLRTDKQYNKLMKAAFHSDLDLSQIVVINISKHLAFNYGFLKPKIVISSGLIKDLSFRELEAVVLHESYHLKKEHVFLFVLAEISKALLFFIPVTNSLVNIIKLRSEISADEAVVSAQGTTKHLSLAFIKTINQNTYFNLYPNFSTSLIENRVNNILKEKIIFSFKKREIFISLLIIIMLIGMFIFPTTGHAHFESEELNILSSCEDTNKPMSSLIVNMTPLK